MQTFMDGMLWLAARGPRYFAGRVYAKIMAPRAKCWPAVKALTGQHGIEVGGPSAMFKARGEIPLYPVVGSLDCCNFGPETVWEGHIDEGRTFHFGNRIGRQFIAEAWKIPVPDASYDFIASCHMLEHSANPLRCLHEWRRIIKPGGHLVLALPDGATTFDRNRPVTTLAHLIEDFERVTGEDDMTHLAEALALHDMTLSPEYRSREALTMHFTDNRANRRLHQHVFDLSLAVSAVKAAGFRVLSSETYAPCHLIVFATKEH